MIFSSLLFLWAFLPLSLFIYYMSPPRGPERNLVLTILSLLFYTFSDIYFLIPILLLTIINYHAGKLIEKFSHRKLLLVLFVSLNLTVLFLYKYLPACPLTFSAFLPRASAYFSKFSLPLGISFFTFQNISYLCDVYKKSVAAEKNPVTYLLYILFFPQLIAGPVIKYKEVRPFLYSRSFSPHIFLSGFKRFSEGLFKKTILAGSLSVISDEMFSLNPTKLPCLYAWLGALAYSMVIYYDFSGYSDMAIGLGRMFGFEFPENFNHPYGAVSMSDFFRRWHMTLTSFFREYVYIPLGGSKKGLSRTIINTLIVFILTGIWHGAGLTYPVWGLYNGIIISAERVIAYKRKTKVDHSVHHLFLTRIITFVLIVLGWVIFRSPSLSYAFLYIKALFAFRPGLYYGTMFYRYINLRYVSLMIFSIIFAFPIRKALITCFPALEKPDRSVILPSLLYVFSTLSLIINTYKPFIYFRF